MKLALVTAGCHRLGAVIAARLAEQGWALALHSHRATEPDRALAAALARHGTPWLNFVADLAEGAACRTLVDDVATHFGVAPKLLVNNASLFEWDDPETVTGDSLRRHFAVNSSAPVLLATRLAVLLPAEENGCVINIVDQRIRHPGADQLSYTLSKQALAGATETLARALAPRVRVNAVAPGLVLPTEDYRPAQLERLVAMMPLARLPEPDDVADAVLWLANAEASTAQTLFVDGGASLQSYARDFVFMAG